MYTIKFKLSKYRKDLNRKAKPIKRSAYVQYLWDKGAGWNE